MPSRCPVPSSHDVGRIPKVNRNIRNCLIINKNHKKVKKSTNNVTYFLTSVTKNVIL